MRHFKKYLIRLLPSLLGVLFYGFPTSLLASDRSQALEDSIHRFIQKKDARIGVAVITEERDTVLVNGRDQFPMLSVYKFPQALAVADYCQRNGIQFSDSIAIPASEIRANTWSPLREKYGIGDLRLPIRELLNFTLTQSDNNACDILFRLIGGPEVADSLINKLGYEDIHIRSTEDEMHLDPELCYMNSASPLAMARLFDDFYRNGLCETSESLKEVGKIMVECATGLSRLPAPILAYNRALEDHEGLFSTSIAKTSTERSDIQIGHKTGTGDQNKDGKLIAINDAGYVILPEVKGYSVAVFVSDSGYDMAQSEDIIADISSIILQCLLKN